jgi:hypothetical protein
MICHLCRRRDFTSKNTSPGGVEAPAPDDKESRVPAGWGRLTTQRVEQKKPDASFPDCLRFRHKPKLWRRAQVNYWAAGLPVPTYKTLSATRMAHTSKHRPSQAPDQPPSEGFDPFGEAQLADTSAD